MAKTQSADSDKVTVDSKLSWPQCISVRDLAERTTMHGCQNVIQSEYHVMRRVIWGLLLLGSAALFLNAFIRGILRYRSYPSAVSADIEPNKNLTLPDVTICNFYSLERTSLNESQSQVVLALLAGNFSQASSNNTPGYASFLIDEMDPVEQFLSNCLMDLNAFNCSDIAKITFTWTGTCYTLALVDYLQRKAQGFMGLKLAVLVDELEYSEHPFSTGMGIRLMLHEHGEIPDENRAIHIEPGTDAYIAMRKSRNMRLGTPYSSDDCREGRGWDSQHSSVYTKQGCELDCFFRYFLHHLGCNFSGRINGTRACSLYEVLIHKMDAFNYIDGGECECLRPCDETTYSADVTTLKRRDTTGNYKWISVNLYYATFDVNVITQEASYDFDAFIADVGGQMGLFLGASILTWTEILECFIVYFVKQFKRK